MGVQKKKKEITVCYISCSESIKILEALSITVDIFSYAFFRKLFGDVKCETVFSSLKTKYSIKHIESKLEWKRLKDNDHSFGFNLLKTEGRKNVIAIVNLQCFLDTFLCLRFSVLVKRATLKTENHWMHHLLQSALLKEFKHVYKQPMFICYCSSKLLAFLFHLCFQ